mgnify:CR=1 FL=1
MDFGHPIFQSGILPVFVAFVLTGAIRMVGGAERGPARKRHAASRKKALAVSPSLLVTHRCSKVVPLVSHDVVLRHAVALRVHDTEVMCARL